MTNPQNFIPADEYRVMQRSLPGVESLYHLLRAVADARLTDGDTVLIVGAGGGREIETLAGSVQELRFLGVDPSPPMLALAQQYADAAGVAARTTLLAGVIDDVPAGLRAGLATSLLVMHFLPDDGAKAAYLAAIRARLRPGAALLLADISPVDAGEFGAMQPLFLAHGAVMGLDVERLRQGMAVMAGLPIVSPARTAQLLAGAGFGAIVPLFQGLWYRAWLATAI